MRSIVSKGKNINEAIQLGLDLLEATKKEVDIEIIQHETKRFLGLGSKEAIVKLTKLESSFSENEKSDSQPLDLMEQLVTELVDEEQVEVVASSSMQKQLGSEDSNEIDSLEGKTWVKDGRLYCMSSPMQVPLVTVKQGIRLYKNNQLVEEATTFVSEKDVYEIKVENEEKETRWDITMDQTKLKVFLEVKPGYKITRKVPDIKADHHIELTVEEQKEINNTLSYGEVMQKLESLRVKHGFHQNEILKAIETTEPSTFEIAKGIEAKPGKDGWVEVKVDMNIQKGPKEKEDGRVDFREIKIIPTAEKGKVIAVIHPPVPGQMGYTVTNEPLPAKQTFPIKLRVGSGVVQVEDKIVATESGRPFIEQRGQLVKASIMPKLTHNGNVDLASGNIRFMGDVEILGEVEERMKVEAEGDIIVRKTVNAANLTASGAIITDGNIFGSEISAGKNNMLVAELGHLLGIIHQNVEKFIKLITQLTQSAAFKSNDFSRGGLQPLIRILLEKKFKHFPPLVKKYVDVVRKGENYLADDAWRLTATSLSRTFLSLSNEVASLEGLMALSQKMKELYEFSKTPVEPDSYVTISNALNSRIYCSGDVSVLGQGCINSKVHSGGKLKISGIVRGGEVYGRLGAEINEVGAESGTATVIAVPNDQKILIHKAMEGTIIKIGNIKHTFQETKYNVRARLHEEERIVFD
jgi:uncharacterized protein